MQDSAAALVHRMADLARLELEPGEAARLAADFARVLEHFQELARLDSDVDDDPARLGADGTAHAREGGASSLRADEPRPSLAPDAILANAPQRVGDFYRVPRTVGGVP